MNIIKTLKSNKAKNFYEVIRDLIKKTALELVESLSILINKWIKEGYFPVECNRVKVLPIHKKRDFNSEMNYRPIWILSRKSKVFEVLIKSSVIAYF